MTGQDGRSRQTQQPVGGFGALYPLPVGAFDAWRSEAVDRRARWLLAGRGQDPAGGHLLGSAQIDDWLPLSGSNMVLVAAGSLQSGWLWLRRDPRDGGVRVLDCTLPPDRTADAMTAVEAFADRVGTRLVTAVRWPGDPQGGDLVRALGGVLSATLMDLTFRPGQVPEPGTLELRPMTGGQFDSYLAGAVQEYARERAGAGEPADVAMANAQESYDRLLPAGCDSVGQWLWTAYDGDDDIGLLWISAGQPHAFAYDLQVRPDRRRRGLGRAIARAGIVHCRAAGRTGVGLNVFGPNIGARALYDELGFRPVEEVYRRTL